MAFPTETVYGLGADGLNPEAVRKIFELKGRPNDNPLILHVARKSDVRRLWTDVPPIATRLMDALWPGPLTLVYHRSDIVPDEVTAGLDTVAVRMPDHKTALALLRAAATPVAAPSANLSGKPSPTLAEHVLEDFDGKIPLGDRRRPLPRGRRVHGAFDRGLADDTASRRCDEGDARGSHRRSTLKSRSACAVRGRGKAASPA